MAVLVPVKGFHTAKGRLASAVSPDQRVRLARWMADGVVRSLDGIDVFVACDDDAVRAWATDLGAHVVWGPGLGLNGAVDDGVEQIAADGYDHVTIAHSDLPRPDQLRHVARPDTVTLVPDRRRDGTNVMAFPLGRRVRASYGAQSFRRHETAARSHGDIAVEIRVDPDLSLDLDTPSDLTHPLIRPLIEEVLPTWLQTNPVNRPTR